jgi:hypothetical protein
MSFAADMIQTHPGAGTVSETLAACIRACLDCAQACTACADACRACEGACQALLTELSA